MSTKLQLGRLLNDDKIVCAYLYNIGERDGKKEKWNKEDKHKSQHLVFLSHNILWHSQCVFEESGSYRSREICDKNSAGEKETKQKQIKRNISRRRLILFKVKKYKKDVTHDVKRWIPDQRRIRKRLKFGIRNFCVQFIY